MKSFLRKIVIFSSIPFSIGLILFATILFMSGFFSIKEYKLDSNISEIFIGDSHIEVAVNDNLIENSINLGESAECFYYSYFKLKLILASNPNIQRVYLGYSYHSLSKFYEKYIKGYFSKSISPRYFYIIPLKEQIKHVIWNLKEFPSYFIEIIKSGQYNLQSKKSYTFSGGYSNEFNEVSASKESTDKRVKFIFYTNGKVNDFSVINQFYLDKIIYLCKTYDVELILFSTPLHSYYRSILPIDYINKYNSIIETTGLKVIDFSTLTLSDECFCPDGDHVSEKGSLLMTKKFNEQYKYKRPTKTMY